jgi:hypothetical protein
MIQNTSSGGVYNGTVTYASSASSAEWIEEAPSAGRGGVVVLDNFGETTGTGYHDHNWGNVGLMEIIHDWYWARGQAGPYSVIASYITAHEKYDYAAIPIFMLTKDAVLIGDDPSCVKFETSDRSPIRSPRSRWRTPPATPMAPMMTATW